MLFCYQQRTLNKQRQKTKMKNHHKNLSRLGTILVVSVSILAQLFAPTLTHADQITTRSLTLVAGTSDGGSKIGGVVNHLFTFTLPTAGNISSIQFQYCTLASGTCTLPTGTVTTAATIGSQAGITGWTLNNTTNGAPYLTRGSAFTIPGTPQVVTYQLNTITNPTTVGGTTFYVRIASFASNNATGSPIDTGTVAASTANQIIVSGTMPESLVFCTGATISLTATVPDCSTATSGSILFNQLFSPTDTATATSQMAASTNAGSGYIITVNGPTLTSGANTIPGIVSPAASTHGIGQFGLNLKANTTATSTVAIGTEVAPTPDGVIYKGQSVPLSGYDTADTFKYVTGNTVANSANGGAGGTNAQIFTVSQPAGTYTSTLTYICTPTY
jgi:hypothetical protein